MTMMKVIRDRNANVINIGDWDYMTEEVLNDETGEVETVVHNPLPEGSVESTEDVIVGSDGGLYLAAGYNGNS